MHLLRASAGHWFGRMLRRTSAVLSLWCIIELTLCADLYAKLRILGIRRLRALRLCDLLLRVHRHYIFWRFMEGDQVPMSHQSMVLRDACWWIHSVFCLSHFSRRCVFVCTWRGGEYYLDVSLRTWFSSPLLYSNPFRLHSCQGTHGDRC